MHLLHADNWDSLHMVRIIMIKNNNYNNNYYYCVFGKNIYVNFTANVNDEYIAVVLDSVLHRHVLNSIISTFLKGAFAVATGVFGDDTESSVLFSVQCTGNETEIMDCAHSTNGSKSCSHHSAAVICQGLNYLTCYIYIQYYTRANILMAIKLQPSVYTAEINIYISSLNYTCTALLEWNYNISKIYLGYCLCTADDDSNKIMCVPLP